MRGRPRASEGAAQARQQLDLLEGLGHEVVRAGVERGDHVRDRRVRAVSTMIGSVTVRTSARRRRQISRPSMRGQAQVEQDEVGLVLGDARRPFSPSATAMTR